MLEKLPTAILISLLFTAAASAQQRFDSPEAAVQALIDATSAHDTAKLTAIFGSAAAGVLTSGKPEQDRAEQTEFSRLASAKKQIEPDPRDPNRALLAIGNDDWPFPVPLVRKNGKWSFDASQTPVEMQARRIGTHELDAIQVCYGYVEAQRKYASQRHDSDGMLQYASRAIAAPGRQDGLYWEGAGTPLVPKAFAEAVQTSAAGAPRAYHGYYFRILDGQGPHAPGGAHNYRVGNRLIGGFALVAWPAKYGVTGIRTFIVNQDGIVFEKDMTSNAQAGASTPVTKYDPDDSWTQVD